MVFFPITGLGRLLLATIIFSYICLLVLNLVSFGGLSWITSSIYNAQFGLWRICVVGVCDQWSGDQNSIGGYIFNGKPGFVKAAQGLEIISLIFYVVAGVLIIMGIIDLERAPLEYMFGGAAVLLFLCIIFLSASLGVMSAQGRNNIPNSSLGWAWWNGLVGLIMTIICVIALVAFILRVALTDYENQFASPVFGSGDPMMMMGGGAISPFSQYSPYNQWLSPPPPPYYTQQIYPFNSFPNSFSPYDNFNPQYPSSIIPSLAQQNLFSMGMFQQQQQFPYPYGQYSSYPY